MQNTIRTTSTHADWYPLISSWKSIQNSLTTSRTDQSSQKWKPSTKLNWQIDQIDQTIMHSTPFSLTQIDSTYHPSWGPIWQTHLGTQEHTMGAAHQHGTNEIHTNMAHWSAHVTSWTQSWIMGGEHGDPPWWHHHYHAEHHNIFPWRVRSIITMINHPSMRSTHSLTGHTPTHWTHTHTHTPAIHHDLIWVGHTTDYLSLPSWVHHGTRDGTIMKTQTTITIQHTQPPIPNTIAHIIQT